MPGSDDDFDPEMLAELRELSSPEDDLLGRVITIFKRDVPERLSAIRVGHATGDCEGLHRASHTLKGAAGNLGLIELMRACEVVVEATRAYELQPRCRDIPPEAIDAIAEAAERALRYLEEAAAG